MLRRMALLPLPANYPTGGAEHNPNDGRKEEGPVSEKLTWTPLDDAAKSMTEANRLAFLPQTLAFSAQTFF